LLSDALDESAAEVWNACVVGVFMPYQAPHRVPPRATLLPATIEELLADPSRTRGLVLEAVPELLTQVSARVASLKILEGALLSLMLSERVEAKGLSHAASRLLGARELAELFGVPDRGSENRLAWVFSYRSNSVTTFASGSKKSNAFSRSAPAKPLDVSPVLLYGAHSYDRQGNSRP
jgi:hypothetical protein